MSYLLDINVLLAFTYESHVFHSKVESWIWHVESTNLERPLFALCSMVALGFIRIASGSSKLAESLFAARSDLRRTKAALQPAFLSDDVEGDRLPSWVTVSKHTTDGHLLELANRHGVQFATLDDGIPGALLIPEHFGRTGVVREPTLVYDPIAWWGRSNATYIHRP